jgi:hypothetical protein
MCAMHAAAMAALEREAHAQKRGTSSRPLNLTVEESMAIFDEPETWSERAQGSAEWVREMARQRVKVRSRVHRGRVRTELARTSSLTIVTTSQPHSAELKLEKAPDL